MFESAEIGHSIDKEAYDAEVPALREALLEAQYELKQQARFPVIVLINGIEGAGKGETVKLLNEWMDPRMIDVLTFDQQTDEELARPPAWRYWRALPPKGRMGVFFGNWYSQMLQGRVHGVFKDAVLDQAITGAERLEQMLCDEGALIIKFWFHLSKKQMKARLKSLKDDPLHSWKISPLDWQQSQTYDRFVRFGERVLRRTSRDYAPWHIIEGVDPNYRSLAVGRILLESLQAALANNPKGKHQGNVAPLGHSIDDRSLLGALDMTLRLDKADYQEQLITEQARLAGLLRDKRMRRHALVAVFEGNDAAGKGAPSAAWRRRWTRGSTVSCRLLRLPKKSAPSRTCGGSGGTSRHGASSPSSTVPGMAGCWWSGWKASAAPLTGCVPTARSTTLKSSWWMPAWWWSSSGWRSTSRPNWSASKSVSKFRSNATRSPRMTGATATSGTNTPRRWVTWSTAPAARSPLGRWWRPMTSAGRG